MRRIRSVIAQTAINSWTFGPTRTSLVLRQDSARQPRTHLVQAFDQQAHPPAGRQARGRSPRALTFPGGCTSLPLALRCVARSRGAAVRRAAHGQPTPTPGCPPQARLYRPPSCLTAWGFLKDSQPCRSVPTSLVPFKIRNPTIKKIKSRFRPSPASAL